MARVLALVESLSDVCIDVQRPSGLQGKLFGVVKHMHILQALVDKFPMYMQDLSSKHVDIVKIEEIGGEGGDGVVNGEIRKKGEYRVTIRIHPVINNVQIRVKV